MMLVASAKAQDEELTEDLDAYHRARFDAARNAGLTRLEACRFSFGQTPLRVLYGLQADGCPSALIAQIVV